MYKLEIVSKVLFLSYWKVETKVKGKTKDLDKPGNRDMNKFVIINEYCLVCIMSENKSTSINLMEDLKKVVNAQFSDLLGGGLLEIL